MEAPIKGKGGFPSVLALAYLGDSVLELEIREYLIRSGKVRLDSLHKGAVRYVSAAAQSKVYDAIGEYLSEEERDVMKSGRNSKKKIPKNVEMRDYRKSTGLEALYGYLHLEGRKERIRTLTAQVVQIIEGGPVHED